jgi:2-alkyl-3-oxoalkanoate reductase
MVQHLCAAGHDVVATGRNPVIGHALRNCTFVPADLVHDMLDPLLDNIDTVFHFAALSSPWGKRVDFELANIRATQQLLAASTAKGVRAFIFASTPSIYTDTKAQLNITEKAPLPLKFANDYAETKYIAEQLVLAHSGPMHVVSLRPRAIVSPYDTVLLPRLIRASERGLMPLPGKGDALIELTDARDVVRAFRSAAERAASVRGRAFNISGGAPRRFADLAAYVFKALRRDVRLLPLNAQLTMILAAMIEKGVKLLPAQPEPPITRYSAMALGWSQTFDLSAAKDALQWQPHFSPEQAIDWALKNRS